MVGESLVVGGLLLDIVGAGILAIPDFPPLFKRLKGGKLEHSIGLFDNKGVYYERENGFDEILKIVYDEYDIPRSQPIDKIVRYGSEPVDFIIFEKDNSQVGDVHPAYWQMRSQVKKRIERQVRRVRGFGLLMLIVGFALQALGTLL